MGFFEKIRDGLSKTRSGVLGQINGLFKGITRIDEDLLEELEDTLVAADAGIDAAGYIIDELRTQAKEKQIKDGEGLKELLCGIVKEILDIRRDNSQQTSKPHVILVVGVNGVGKTTTIAKLAAMYKAEGKKVLLGAADTFRAAAAEQLAVWAGRAGADIVRQKEGTDPAAVVYDALSAGKSRGADIVICDTAGRLHNKKNLMDELSKIMRVISREAGGDLPEVLLVCDATTGQNGLNQAREFAKAAPVTGIVLTKLDGTAKGGIVIAIAKELGIPIKYIGVGEKLDDLQSFDAGTFAAALFDGVAK